MPYKLNSFSVYAVHLARDQSYVRTYPPKFKRVNVNGVK